MKRLRTATEWLSDPKAMAHVRKRVRQLTTVSWKKWARRYVDGWQYAQLFEDGFLCGNLELLTTDGVIELQDVVWIHTRETWNVIKKESYYNSRRQVIGELKEGGQDFTDWFVGRTWAPPEMAADAHRIARLMVSMWGIRSVAEMIDGEEVVKNALRAATVRRLLAA